MEEIAISEFKERCLAVLERVRKTRKSILVTRFGEPIAEVVPPAPTPKSASWIGSMAGTARIRGDVTKGVVPTEDWEALK